MFLDARELEGNAVLEGGVCIVGGGPAGITLARELQRAGVAVVLLESGGFDFNAEIQALGQAGEVRGIDAGPLQTRRQFGGNASAWAVHTDLGPQSVRLARLSAGDFERRDWIDDSGWPIGLSDLAPYYERARDVFQLAPGGYATEAWEESACRRLPRPSEDIATQVFQFASGEVFTKVYRQELEHAANITVCYHATALEIETDADGTQVTGVRAASLPGREFRVRARTVVLAAGGMACVQLLLQSDRARPEGLGNRFDLVGRYFMDHPLVEGGEFVPYSRNLFEAMTFYDLRTVRRVPVMGHLQIADAGMAREKLLQLSLMFFPRIANEMLFSARQLAGAQAAVRARAALRRRRLPAVGDVGKTLLGLDGVLARRRSLSLAPGPNIGRGGWSKELDAHHRYDRFEIVHQAEQRPRRDNRVMLGKMRDALGGRKLVIDWRWHDDDMADTMRAQDFYARKLKEAGLGDFRILRPDGRPKVKSFSTAHYIGMTRMNTNPEKGVVDARCKVHGLRNLFVASTTVFPTGGFANPTLTLIALTLRIADLISQFG